MNNDASHNHISHPNKANVANKASSTHHRALKGVGPRNQLPIT